MKATTIEAKCKRFLFGNIWATKHITLWTETDGAIKQAMETNLSLNSNETPAIVCYSGLSRGWVITNTRLIVLEVDSVYYIPFNTIQRLGQENLKTMMLNAVEGKLDELEVVMTDSTLIIQVENKAWFTIYNVLRWLINREDKKDTH